MILETSPHHQLYADGGVIRSNPSTFGGTWAWRRVQDDEVILEHSGIITPLEAQLPAITNNLTEMFALIQGLSALPSTWEGTVYSDSQVTLGRVFGHYRWTGIPDWLLRQYHTVRRRLVCWDSLQYVLLDGHPTRAQLTQGIGKRGHPVSIHNVACDKACSDLAATFFSLETTTNPSRHPHG